MTPLDCLSPDTINNYHDGIKLAVRKHDFLILKTDTVPLLFGTEMGSLPVITI